jgi:WD40 repeat protein
VLAHIFSFLDPEGFAAASLVCREWHSVASDDYAWKAAFDRFFGVHDVIPRLSTSWRGEYIHRSHLLRYSCVSGFAADCRKWQLGRGPVSFYDCEVGSELTHLSALPPLPKRRQSRQMMARSVGQPFLLHGSIPKGIVTASDPTTGQVFREQITHPETWRAVTQSIALYNNTVAFGTATGRVSIVDVNHRRKIDGGWKPMQERHSQTVTALLFLREPFRVKVPGLIDGATVHLVSASAGGEVFFHDTKTGLAHGQFRIPGTPITQYITYLEYFAETDTVVVGTCTGDVWLLHTQGNTDPRQVPATEYDAKSWDMPQDVVLDQTSGLMSPQTDIFFLSDIRNQFVFVIRGNSIRRYEVTDSNVTNFTKSEPHKYTCASMNPDHAAEGYPLFFAVGDIKGTVSVYNARQSQPFNDSTVSPLYTISTVPDVKVTSLAINSLVIITGSNDGTAKTYSSLDGTPLRTLCAPSSRRRHLRPPSSAGTDLSHNPITAISITAKTKSEVRGAIAFQFGHVRYWNFAPDGVGIMVRSRKRRRHRVSAKEIRGFVDDEIERDREQKEEDETKRKRWEKMNGGIEEEDVALQVALMMSREEDERRKEFQIPEEIEEDPEVDFNEGVDEWVPGRNISFGSTSGSASPASKPGGNERRLEDVAVFRSGNVPEVQRSNTFDEDLEFAIRLSLAEQESRETHSIEED